MAKYAEKKEPKREERKESKMPPFMRARMEKKESGGKCKKCGMSKCKC